MTRTSRIIGAMILVAGFQATIATVASAQSVAGKWSGTVTTQQGGQPVTVQLDSAAAGWTGTATSDMAGSVALYNISVKGDTVKFSLDVQGTAIGMFGIIAADHKVMNGSIYFEGNEAGTFKFTHADAEKPKAPPQL